MMIDNTEIQIIINVLIKRNSQHREIRPEISELNDRNNDIILLSLTRYLSIAF